MMICVSDAFSHPVILCTSSKNRYIRLSEIIRSFTLSYPDAWTKKEERKQRYFLIKKERRDAVSDIIREALTGFHTVHCAIASNAASSSEAMTSTTTLFGRQTIVSLSTETAFILTQS